MVFSGKSSQNHPNQIGRQNGFTAGPQRQSPQAKQHQQYPFGPDGGGSATVLISDMLRNERKKANYYRAHHDKDQGLVRERSKYKPQSYHRSKVVDKTSAKDTFTKFRPIEAGLQHHRI